MKAVNSKNRLLTLTEVSIMIIFLLLSMRIYLLGNGYYEYADQYWSIIPGTTSFASFLPDSGFLFTRIIISWPVLFFTNLPSVIGEKITIIYLVSFYFTLIYVVLTIIRRMLEKSAGMPMEWWKRLIFFSALFILIFTNIENQNLFVDGGMVTDNIIILLMILSFFLVFNNSKFWFLEIPSFLSITTLLDPDYLPMFLILILVAFVFSNINKAKLVNTFPKIILSLMLWLPALMFIVLNINISTGGFLLHSTGLRQFSPSAEFFYSKNLNLISVLSLNGHFWSTEIFTSPSILFHLSSIGTFSGIANPTNILIIPGIIFKLWYISLFVPLAMSLSSLIYPKGRKTAIAGFAILVISIIMALYAHIPPILHFIEYVTNLPYFGNFLGTSLSLPGHFLLLVSVAYDIIAITFLFNFLMFPLPNFCLSVSKETGKRHYVIKIARNHTLKGNSKLNQRYNIKVIFSIILIGLLLFSGWQSINGDFFPARYQAFAPTLPNGVVDSAPFEPQNMTVNQLSVYNYIYNQKGDFNIYWPGIEWPSGQGWVSPKPQASLPYITDLVSNNLSFNTYYYLKVSDVKYVIVQNNSGLSYTSSNPNLLETDFGLSSYDAVLHFFQNVPNLTEIYNYPGLSVFEVLNSTLQDVSNYLPIVDTSNTLYIPYVLLGSLGLNPLIMNYGNYTSIGMDNSLSVIDIIPPSNVSEPSNVNTFQFNGNFSANLIAKNVQVANFTFTNWSSNYSSFQTNKHEINLSGIDSSISSISYGGNMISRAGGIALSPDKTYKLSVSFNLNKSDNVSYVGVSWFGWANNQSYELSSHQFMKAIGPKNSSFVINSNSYSYIAARLNIGGNNYSATIANLTYNLYTYPNENNTPFGYYLPINGTRILDMPIGKNFAYIMLKGNGSINGNDVNLDKFTWMSISGHRNINITGKFGIAAIVFSNESLNSLSVKGLVLNQFIPYLVWKNSTATIFPTETVNSLAFYAGNGLNSTFLVYYDNTTMWYYYIIVVAIIVSLLIIPVISKNYYMKGKNL